MAMPLLVLDLPLLHCQLLLHLGFGLRLGHDSDVGVAVGAVGMGEGFGSGMAKVGRLLWEGEWSLRHCWGACNIAGEHMQTSRDVRADAFQAQIWALDGPLQTRQSKCVGPLG
jgi:hypothetical protein